jgi:ATP-dependent DNA helicase RecG
MDPTFQHPELRRPVQDLKGVGPARAEMLGHLGIASVADLLLHMPRSYDDLSQVRGFDELTAGEMQTVVGEVVELDSKHLDDGRRVFSAVIADPKGRCLEGVWFNQVVVARQLRYGLKVAFSGKPKWFRGHWTMQHPRVEVLEQSKGEEPSRQIIPIYPLTEGLNPEHLRDYIRQALSLGAEHVVEMLPPQIRAKRNFALVAESLWHLHFPEVLAQGLQAKRRFIYEEFLALQVALAVRRREVRDRHKAPILPVDTAIDAHIRKRIPFPLTDDQNRAVRSICKDLASDRPMQRLLQADVGAGKTAVAVYALLVAVANKHQAALMAPTEVLARQHWDTLEQYLDGSRVRRRLLTGSLSPLERTTILDEIRSGQVDLVVGTQSLVQAGVEFARLGLVVIDEQHKFGVHQRARMRKLAASPLDVDPHYLVMTATPIPRTIALTVFGDLDVSTIHQLPPGRHPVVTRWHSESQRERVYENLRRKMREGHQAYVVCPLVDESESLDVKAAEQEYESLRRGPFKDFRVGLLHGRLDEESKHEVMRAFRAGDIQLLVSTLVIEVGVDVPNATLMLIEHAERFGLSQLHQLRGRVSRGKVPGECILFTGTTTDDAQVRLRAFTKISDGFALAEEDARLRGIGEFFGTRQHGLGDLRIGDLLKDRELLDMAREDAMLLVHDDPGLRRPEHAALRNVVLERYGKTLDLAAIG